MRNFILVTVSVIATTLFSPLGVGAQVMPASGYVYAPLSVGDVTESCVAAGPGGTFVAVGPGFTGNGQRVVFVTESGGQRVVVSGLNSVGDCAYDAGNDTLYVSDNGLEAIGAVTGDTVFAVPAASTASGLTAVGLELAPPGSVANAASVVVDADGGVLVSDASGGGVGSVRRVEGGATTSIISGLDFVGGLAFEPNGNLLVAQSLPTFEAEIRRYDLSGTLVTVVSGPTFAHGSFDLARLWDGTFAVTGSFGGDVVALDAVSGGIIPLVSGLTFASGVDVDSFTGRISILSSTFVPTEEDRTVHRLVPVSRLVAGKGSDKKECVHEFYGLELVAAKPGKKARKALCVDGGRCDADGVINDVCVFPVGFCVGLNDMRMPRCQTSEVAAFELAKVKPDSPEIATAVLAAQAVLPVAGPMCTFSDGMRVPVKTTRKGLRRPGKGTIKVKVTTGGTKARKDTDKVKLVCVPALS